jgi:hypothetical protein
MQSNNDNDNSSNTDVSDLLYQKNIKGRVRVRVREREKGKSRDVADGLK